MEMCVEMNDYSRHSISAELYFIISDDDIDSIMYAALNGGISRWCGSVQADEDVLAGCLHKQITRKGTLKLFDLTGEMARELTFDKFMIGLQRWVELERPFTVMKGVRLNVRDISGRAVGRIIQFALFNDLPFG